MSERDDDTPANVVNAVTTLPHKALVEKVQGLWHEIDQLWGSGSDARELLNRLAPEKNSIPETLPGSVVFKTTAIDHSAISPLELFCSKSWRLRSFIPVHESDRVSRGVSAAVRRCIAVQRHLLGATHPVAAHSAEERYP
jgi:hypothetical protein